MGFHPIPRQRATRPLQTRGVEFRGDSAPRPPWQRGLPLCKPKEGCAKLRTDRGVKLEYLKWSEVVYEQPKILYSTAVDSQTIEQAWEVPSVEIKKTKDKGIRSRSQPTLVGAWPGIVPRASPARPQQDLKLLLRPR